MRQAINENPRVQIAVISVLVLVVGFIMMKQLGGGEETVPPPVTDAGVVPAPGVPATGDPAVAAPVTSPAPTGSATAAPLPASAGTAPATAGSVTPEALVPGPGLPPQVVRAYASGDAIVLLIVRGGSVDDRLVRSSVNALSGDSRLAVFVVPVAKVARYSRITQGVGVNRVPALVVVRPRRLSGDTPQAQVSYGFRNAESVEQAVEDALYGGRDDVPYHPG